jgi:hypothetical protein
MSLLLKIDLSPEDIDKLKVLSLKKKFPSMGHFITHTCLSTIQQHEDKYGKSSLITEGLEGESEIYT